MGCGRGGLGLSEGLGIGGEGGRERCAGYGMGWKGGGGREEEKIWGGRGWREGRERRGGRRGGEGSEAKDWVDPMPCTSSDSSRICKKDAMGSSAAWDIPTEEMDLP